MSKNEMSGQHTQGLLETTQILGWDWSIRTVKTDKFGCSQIVSSGITEANARRLAACWNACEGLTQDHFDGGWTAMGLSKYAKSLEGKLATARTLLSDALETFDDNPHEDHEVADRIRAFLAPPL